MYVYLLMQSNTFEMALDFSLCYTVKKHAFSALILLVVHQEQHLACKIEW